jgi:hypothetical protein
MRTVRIFISSPSDLNQERVELRKLISRISKVLEKLADTRLEIVDWQSTVSPAMGHPQSIISKAAKFSECDLFLGMFWSRFGTPTGRINPTSGVPFQSGTEEEFFEAYEAWKTSCKPNIIFYRCTRSLPIDVDPKQLLALNTFFAGFQADGANPGLYKSFNDTDELTASVENDLFRYAKEHCLAPFNEETLSVSPLLTKLGVLSFYTPEFNDERNRAKKTALLSTKRATLMAFGGYSYVALHNHRFRGEVEIILQRGGEFRVLILNPWCEWTFMKALAYKSNQMQLADIRAFDAKTIIEVIKSSVPYRITLQNSLDGYKYLSEMYGSKISMTVTNWAMEYTCLITDKELFLEPYMMSTIKQRAQTNFNTFEVRFGAEAGIHQAVSQEVDYRIQQGFPVDRLLTDEEALIQEFLERHAINRGSLC